MPCSNAAKTRNLLKFAGVPQTTASISAASAPKFTILRGHVEDILLLNKFFPIVDKYLSCEDIARQICGMMPRWRFLATFMRPVFSGSRVQQVLDLHLKFALRPHHVEVWQTSNLRRLRLGVENKKKIEIKGQKYNGLPYYMGDHKNVFVWIKLITVMIDRAFRYAGNIVFLFLLLYLFNRLT